MQDIPFQQPQIPNPETFDQKETLDFSPHPPIPLPEPITEKKENIFFLSQHDTEKQVAVPSASILNIAPPRLEERVSNLIPIPPPIPNEILVNQPLSSNNLSPTKVEQASLLELILKKKENMRNLEPVVEKVENIEYDITQEIFDFVKNRRKHIEEEEEDSIEKDFDD